MRGFRFYVLLLIASNSYQIFIASEISSLVVKREDTIPCLLRSSSSSLSDMDSAGKANLVGTQISGEFVLQQFMKRPGSKELAIKNLEIARCQVGACENKYKQYLKDAKDELVWATIWLEGFEERERLARAENFFENHIKSGAAASVVGYVIYLMYGYFL